MRKLTICGLDITKYAIVLNPIPDPAEKTAAEFLVRVIETVCGVKLPVSDSAEHGIYIGTREPSPDVKWDGFRTTTDERNLYLDGNISRGTLYAAYDFAEKYLGYRRFAIDCEVIPSEGEADIPVGFSVVDNPAFEVRRNSNYDRLNDADMASAARLNADIHTDMNAGHGGVVFDFIDCHTYQKYCSAAEYGESHPEYFALVNGVRENVPGHQLCLSNPDVLRIVTENVLAELRAHPETGLIDFSQEDGPLNCSCEHCAAIDAEEGGTPAGSMIRFVNALAEAVEKEFPDVMIQTFAYEYSTKPPKLTKARENVIIRYCTYDACFRHAIDDPDCAINSVTVFNEMKGWGEMCHHMSIWNYAANYSCYAAPFPNLRSLREDHRFFADCNAIHVYNENISPNVYRIAVDFDELRSYLNGKLMWDPYMTEEEYNRHMNEFLAAYYGKGWEHIRRYIDLVHDVTANRCITCKEEFDICFVHYVTYPPIPMFKPFFRRSYTAKPYQPVYPDHALTGLCERMDEAETCMDAALAMAEKDEERERIGLCRYFLNYLKLFCMEHDEFKMTKEEKAAYEAECEQFYKDKKKYHGYYNIHTTNRGN
ncbi:MAG: DUF4838 domain-containing protein [Ruminococcaceae bacterium]|nr:DUF4838 domain-containing protein [Oscillospiraceae bacterium]